jgi:hypothetical protein
MKCGRSRIETAARFREIAGKKKKETIMRKIILFGATALALTFGAANAYAMGGGDLSPEQSPYALLAPQTLHQSPTSEGRSSSYGGQGPGSWSGNGVQPSYFVTPQDRNDYLNGR